MATQTIKTIIKLKQKEYSYWEDPSKGAPTNKTAGAGEGAYYVPHYGEVCFCEITGANQDTQTSPPTVLFKVGNGKDYFKDLNWASALASDVYDWAKASDVKFENNKLVFVGGRVDGKDKEIDLSALSVDIPALTVKQTTSDVLPTGDTVDVVTNVLNSDGDYELTVTRHKVPTKEYVDNAIGTANAAVTYLGILNEPAEPGKTDETLYAQICGQLSETVSKGDFYRAGFTFGANTTLNFLGFHTGDLIIAEKDGPEKLIDGDNWSVIHCHETEEIVAKLRDHFIITDEGILQAKEDETNRGTKGFSIVDESPSGLGKTHYLNGGIDRYDITGAINYTYAFPATGGTFVLAGQENITYILDCN